MSAGIGTSLEALDPAFVESVLPGVDYVEIIPDTLAQRQGGRAVIPRRTLELLDEISRHATLIVHGVGLSIGSFERWNDDYFRLLDQLLDRVPVAWHSEHLAFTHVDGRFCGTMLALPRTRQALDLVAARAQRIVERYPLPFLLENTVNLLPDPPADFGEAAFLNALAQQSGCGLLLDLYNLECQAHNQRWTVSGFLAELELDAVREIHVAGGVEHRGLMLDVHSRPTRASTRDLLSGLLPRARRLEAIVYEIMPEAVPALGHRAWAEEVARLDALIAA